MRLFLSVAYCVFLTVLMGVFLSRDHTRPTVTTAAFERNHLLREQDLDPRQQPEDGLVGKYLRVASASKATITSMDVTAVPALEAAAGKPLLVLGGERSLVQSGNINAGTVVQVCIDKKPVSGLTSLKIRAVICLGPTASHCSIITEFDSTGAATALMNASASSQPTVRPSNSTCS